MPKSTQTAETIILEEGIEVQQTKAYGIGIDCHSKFIQVSVYVKRDLKFFEYRRELSTDWNSLIHAKEWCVKVLATCSSPLLDLSDMSFHYCTESTSTYHMPVLLAWEGTPIIINPTIAGASKRKTDVLNAEMLALHDLTGIWPESYLPSVDVKELRVLISERSRFVHDATAAGSRINNIIVRFGLTVGRDGSVVKNQAVRAVIEDQISSDPSMSDGLCPFGIPADMFGKWGYNLYLQTGKWKKAANAVARKFATALYYMMLTGQKFSYENYGLMKDISIFDIPVSELPLLNPDFKRYIRILQDSGIHTTSEMAAAYFFCRLGTVKGLGKKFFALIKDLFNNQKKYKSVYNELRKGEMQNEP